MTTDVFHHPWLSGLFGDDEIAAYLSGAATLTHMIEVEATYARTLGQVGHVDRDIAERAAIAIRGLSLDLYDLRAGMRADGVVIPEFVRLIKEQLPASLHAAVHVGLTSQDVIDTSLVLSLKKVLATLIGRLDDLKSQIATLIARHGGNFLQGRTRMQAALEITVKDRLINWQAPLQSHRDRLCHLAPRLLVLQLGGPAGNRASFRGSAAKISEIMKIDLGLYDTGTCWHVTRDNLAEFASCLSLITGSLGKIGQDISLMAQQGIDDIVLAGGGTSSAMPHKQNPIEAELLVALARFNATLLPAMHHSLIHEQERSGAAWTLEWMILPQMLLVTGRALGCATELCAQIRELGN